MSTLVDWDIVTVLARWREAGQEYHIRERKGPAADREGLTEKLLAGISPI